MIFVFITNGGLVESTTEGNQNTPAGFNPALKKGSGWETWNRIAAVDPSFWPPTEVHLRPEPDEVDERDRHHACLTIIPYIEDHRALAVRRPHRDRRHRERQGLELGSRELDD